MAGGSAQSLGPGAMAAAERSATSHELRAGALQLGMSIATGIGLHNFSEGLAIGQAATSGEIRLAVLLVVGFALHNATEGFGIVGPLAAGGVRASWSYLLVAGLVGGGPTFVGTLIGQTWTSEVLSIAFLALAGGSILYVVMELVNVNRRLASKATIAWFVILGLMLGFATEFIIEAAGV